MHDHDELGPVGGHQGQAVTRPDALYGEMARRGVARPQQLGIGPAIVTRQDGGMVRELAGGRRRARGA